MRNLVVLQARRWSREGQASTIIDLAENSFEANTFLLLETGMVVAYGEEGQMLWEVQLPPQEANAQWLYAAYNGENNVVTAISTSGDLFSVSCDDQSIEQIGAVDSGIVAASWSPDEEILLLVNGQSEALALSAAYDCLYEVPLVEPIVVNEAVSISWRGDGQYAAISAVEASSGQRKLRVYERGDLRPHSFGRHEDGSEVKAIGPSLAWATDGTIIATTQEIKGKMQVIFFERNGLRHREFLLPGVNPQDHQVPILRWNAETDLLAIAINPINSTTDSAPHSNSDSNGRKAETVGSRVQLWHRSNYHWYLKHEARYDGLVTQLRFDPEKAYRLHVGVGMQPSPTRVSWHRIDLCWDVHCSGTRHSTVAVVDGPDLLLTPLGRALVPPPMSFSKVTTQAPVVALGFEPYDAAALPLDCDALSTPEVAALVVMTSSGLVEVFKGEDMIGRLDLYKEKDHVGLDPRLLRQMVVLSGPASGGRVSFLSILGTDKTESLVELSFQLDGKGGSSDVRVERARVDVPVLRIQAWDGARPGVVLVELEDGSLLRYTTGGAQVEPLADSLLEPCPWVGMVDLGGNRQAVIGLSSRSRLYFRDQLLCPGVSTFRVAPWHRMLTFTTIGSRPEQHFVSFMELSKVWDPLEGDEAGNRPTIGTVFETRSLERGSRLVAIIPASSLVVLQVTRGNLEGVYPRALVLGSARRMLDQGLYGMAFNLLRRQRVDLNMLVDHHPQRFVSDIDHFLDQVTSTDDLNLFIFSLTNDNVITKRYPPPPWYPIPDEEAQTAFNGDKQNRVCQLIREGLIRKRGTSAAVQPILSTYARQEPPKLDEALQLICEECRSKRGEKLSGETGQKLIKYLSFFAKVDHLYDTALGMYDYDLVRAVARQSQKDPREYLPYLERLQSLPSWKAKWEIDLQLKRYIKALGHLAGQGKEEEVNAEECLRVVETYDLQEGALALFDQSRFPTLHQRLLASHADHLMKLGEPRRAMVTYLSQQPPELLKAAQAAKAAGQWRQALNLVAQHDPTGKSVHMWAQQIAKDLTDVAKDKTMVRDAGLVRLEYLDDVEGAVASFLEAGAWIDATSACYRHGRKDLVVTDVWGAAREHQEILTEDLKGRKVSYESKYARWLVVKEKAREEEEDEQGMEALDDQHETRSQYSAATEGSEGSLISRSSAAHSSVSMATSLLSIRTNAPGITTTLVEEQGASSSSSFKVTWSSNTRAKKLEQKKKGKTKKVRMSARKEMTELLLDMRGMVPSPTTFQEVGDLMEALVVQGDTKRANDLEEAMVALVECCQAHPLPDPEEANANKPSPPHLEAPSLQSSSWRFFLKDF